MAQIQMQRVEAGNQGNVGSAPLIALFERDDSIAVPLLSQIRMAGYDVRAARTPVELFDLLGKSFVSLVLVDLGAATAGRREFWVALDAQRRGRALQVMTFRYISPASAYDLEFETSARAIADVEIRSAHELPRIVEGVRQRIPLNGVLPGVGVSLPPGAPIPPIGSALGAPAPFSMPLAPSAQVASPFGGAHFGGVPLGAPGASPFATPGYPGYPNLGYQQPGQFGQANPPYAASPYNPSMPSMPSVPPMASAPSMPGAQPWGMSQQPNPYTNLPPLYVSPLSPLPSPGSSVGSGGGAPGWENSPFAHPIGANPFATDLEQSPFDQPYAVNPFAGDPSPATPPQAAGPAPYSAPYPAPQMNAFASASMPFSGASLASQYGPPSVAPRVSAPGYASQASYADEDDDIQDAWVPPDADEGLDGQTGIVPEVAFQSTPSLSSLSSMSSAPRNHPADRRRIPQSPQAPQPNMQSSSQMYQSRPAKPSVSRQATAAQVPAIRFTPDPAEEALGAVLVEGALLTPSKLDALKGIQQMLAGVNMPIKLGELALRFKFLSQDQLLAAVLVSRRMVSPQQIASLGRVKRELAATGMDHDLETLLLMFNMLPIETLHELRDELGIGQEN